VIRASPSSPDTAWTTVTDRSTRGSHSVTAAITSFGSGRVELEPWRPVIRDLGAAALRGGQADSDALDELVIAVLLDDGEPARAAEPEWDR
jgi:hypothetical protein